MKTCMMATICLVLATTVWAQDDWRSRCQTYSGLAEQIMQSRQAGAPMVKMMEIATHSSEQDVSDFVEKAVISAYESPRLDKKELQKRAVEDFRDKMYLDCVKANRPE